MICCKVWVDIENSSVALLLPSFDKGEINFHPIYENHRSNIIDFLDV